VIGVAAEGVVKLDAELARRAAAASAASLRLSNCAFSGGGTRRTSASSSPMVSGMNKTNTHVHARTH
jgi:hypothetical protein